MNKRKTLSMIGMSKKAGKLRQGFDVVKEALLLGEAETVWLTCDLSERTAGQIKRIAQEVGAEVIASELTMEDIGAITGKASGIIAIADEGLAGAVKNAMCLEEEME